MGTGRAGCLDFLPLSERLNPPVSLRQGSSGRAFDPVFEGTGWGRKKIGGGKEEVLRSSLPTGNTSAEDVERRKRTFTTSDHTVAVLTCSLPLLAGTGTSCLRDTRFSKGFARRRVEHPHANEISEEAAVKAELAANQRRSVLVSNDTRAGCNPLNGGPPLVGKHADYVPPRIHIKPKGRIESEAGRPGHAEKEGKRREMAAERRHRLQLDVCTCVLSLHHQNACLQNRASLRVEGSGLSSIRCSVTMVTLLHNPTSLLSFLSSTVESRCRVRPP